MPVDGGAVDARARGDLVDPRSRAARQHPACGVQDRVDAPARIGPRRRGHPATLTGRASARFRTLRAAVRRASETVRPVVADRCRFRCNVSRRRRSGLPRRIHGRRVASGRGWPTTFRLVGEAHGAPVLVFAVAGVTIRELTLRGMEITFDGVEGAGEHVARSGGRGPATAWTARCTTSCCTCRDGADRGGALLRRRRPGAVVRRALGRVAAEDRRRLVAPASRAITASRSRATTRCTNARLCSVSARIAGQLAVVRQVAQVAAGPADRARRARAALHQRLLASRGARALARSTRQRPLGVGDERHAVARQARRHRAVERVDARARRRATRSSISPIPSRCRGRSSPARRARPSPTRPPRTSAPCRRRASRRSRSRRSAARGDRLRALDAQVLVDAALHDAVDELARRGRARRASPGSGRSQRCVRSVERCGVLARRRGTACTRRTRARCPSPSVRPGSPSRSRGP